MALTRFGSKAACSRTCVPSSRGAARRRRPRKVREFLCLYRCLWALASSLFYRVELTWCSPVPARAPQGGFLNLIASVIPTSLQKGGDSARVGGLSDAVDAPAGASMTSASTRTAAMKTAGIHATITPTVTFTSRPPAPRSRGVEYVYANQRNGLSTPTAKLRHMAW